MPDGTAGVLSDNSCDFNGLRSTFKVVRAGPQGPFRRMDRRLSRALTVEAPSREWRLGREDETLTVGMMPSILSSAPPISARAPVPAGRRMFSLVVCLLALLSASGSHASSFPAGTRDAVRGLDSVMHSLKRGTGMPICQPDAASGGTVIDGRISTGGACDMTFASKPPRFERGKIDRAIEAIRKEGKYPELFLFGESRRFLVLKKPTRMEDFDDGIKAALNRKNQASIPSELLELHLEVEQAYFGRTGVIDVRVIKGGTDLAERFPAMINMDRKVVLLSEPFLDSIKKEFPDPAKRRQVLGFLLAHEIGHYLLEKSVRDSGTTPHGHPNLVGFTSGIEEIDYFSRHAEVDAFALAAMARIAPDVPASGYADALRFLRILADSPLLNEADKCFIEREMVFRQKALLQGQ